MRDRIRKDLKVEIDFVNRSISVVGTVTHVDRLALVVSLAPNDDRKTLLASLTKEEDVCVTAAGDDALYRFRSRLLRSSALLMYLSPPGEIERFQRRENVRERCLLMVEFVALQDLATGQRRQGTAVNISCGGLMLVCDARIEVGDHVEVSIHLTPGAAPLQAAGTVVRTEQVSRFGRNLYRAALHLTGLTRSDEKRLLQFITRLQVGAVSGTVREMRTRQLPRGHRR